MDELESMGIDPREACLPLLLDMIEDRSIIIKNDRGTVSQILEIVIEDTGIIVIKTVNW